MPRLQTGPLARALVVEHPDPVLDELLAAEGIAVERLSRVPDEEELITALQRGRHGLLFKRSRVPVSRALVAACPDLAAVQLCCIGDDSVDKVACAEAGVLVFNDPVSNGRSVVELAIAHLIALSRRLFETDCQTRSGGFDKSQAERWEVQGKVLGVLGLGNIGRAVARAADALGMKILFHDTREVAREVGLEMGWDEAPTMEALFRRSDAVTVHVSATDARGRRNRGLITRAHFAQLGVERQPSSPRLFLNLARGFLHEPADLLQAVAAREVRRAAVDVYPDEPRGQEAWSNPYASEPRIAVTPHMGAATVDAQPRIARRVAHTVRGFARFGSLRDCVFRPRLQLGLGEVEAGTTLLAVVHSTTRGSRKALQDAVFEAGASNLSTVHQDFEDLGMAYDLLALDRPLSDAELAGLTERAASLTGDEASIRSVRQWTLS
jgi:D-3-phosphoglycerate dehydrogenase